MGDAELVNLILQRTRPFITRCGKAPLAHWTRTGDTSGLVMALGPSRDAYIAEALAEIEQDVAAFIEAAGDIRPRRIVSIGPGNGHADALLCRHYRAESVLLIDTESGGMGHGFQQQAAGYASLATTASRMPCHTLTWNPCSEPEPDYLFDLAVSMYALGFHFPADSYDSFLLRNANAGAVLIHHAR